jgi:hypothetical protein
MPNTAEITSQTSAYIEIIKIAIWPTLVFIIFLFVRSNIYSLIDRIKKIGHGKTTIETGQQQFERKPARSGVDIALGLFKPQTVANNENNIKTQIGLDKLESDPEKIDQLLKLSVVLSLIVRFEKLYNLIFGSQIRILQQLNSGEIEDRASLKRFYEYVERRNPEFFKTYEYDSYLNFLISSNVIIEHPDGKIKITDLGNDFLKYLIDTGKQFNKEL